MNGNSDQKGPRILGVQDITDIRNLVNSFGKDVAEYTDHMQTIIELFKTEDPTVQSLFGSGNFGQIQQENLELINKALINYYNIINGDDGLVAATNKYLNAQESRLQTGK
jgi:hypothetical protein